MTIAHNNNNNTSLLAVDSKGDTPFDFAIRNGRTANPDVVEYLNKVTQDHGRLALLVMLCSIESPVSFPDVPLTVVEEEEIVELWVQHIQTINHIFQLK